MPKKLHIISADDDLDDQDLIEEALKKTELDHLLSRVADGAKLLKYLNDISRNGLHLPDVIFLDLNMPIKDGRETIKALKSKDSSFKTIPLAVLTTSSSVYDMNHCINSGADLFLVKPNSFKSLVSLLQDSINVLCLNDNRGLN